MDFVFQNQFIGVPQWVSGLRIWGHCYGTALIPDPGTSYAMGAAKKKKKKKIVYCYYYKTRGNI